MPLTLSGSPVVLLVRFAAEREVPVPSQVHRARADRRASLRLFDIKVGLSLVGDSPRVLFPSVPEEAALRLPGVTDVSGPLEGSDQHRGGGSLEAVEEDNRKRRRRFSFPSFEQNSRRDPNETVIHTPGGNFRKNLINKMPTPRT